MGKKPIQKLRMSKFQMINIMKIPPSNHSFLYQEPQIIPEDSIPIPRAHDNTDSDMFTPIDPCRDTTQFQFVPMKTLTQLSLSTLMISTNYRYILMNNGKKPVVHNWLTLVDRIYM